MIANYAGLPSCLFVEVSLVTGDACSVRVKGCPTMSIVKLVGTRQLLEIIIAGWPSCIKGTPRVPGYQGQPILMTFQCSPSVIASPSTIPNPVQICCALIIAMWKREGPVHDIAMPAAKHVYDN